MNTPNETAFHSGLQTALPVFYSDAMGANAASFSPSASKPRSVVASWRSSGLPITVIAPLPATIDELALAHDRRHVAAVLAGDAENGFGNCLPEVAATLPFTTGAMLSGARHVLRYGGFAAAPCSGFHHAGYRHVAGFCTFNGLMVTACTLKAEGAASCVGILDFDMHYGDGTDEIIDGLRARGWVRHFTAGRTYGSPRQAKAFLAKIPEIARSMSDCDVVLYQAGADPHIADPLGGWLTTQQLRLRDAAVFAAFRDLEIPVVWNLAGGYQVERDGSIPKVLEIHDNTALECVRASVRTPSAELRATR